MIVPLSNLHGPFRCRFFAHAVGTSSSSSSTSAIKSSNSSSSGSAYIDNCGVLSVPRPSESAVFTTYSSDYISRTLHRKGSTQKGGSGGKGKARGGKPLGRPLARPSAQLLTGKKQSSGELEQSAAFNHVPSCAVAYSCRSTYTRCSDNYASNACCVVYVAL
jgi:hypothetical protein